MASNFERKGTTMKKMLILGGIALAAVAAPAAAQPPQPQPLADAPMRHHREARPITRADFQQRLQAHFAKLDVNRDGYVDRNETGGMNAMGPRGDNMGPAGMREEGPRGRHARRDPNAMFDTLDANRDGNVTRQEFLAFHAAHGPRGAGGPMAHGEATPMAGPDGGARPMRPRRAGMGMGFGGRWFDRVDADHDGRASLAEAQRAGMAMFDRLDANHDGTISPDERAAARQAFRARRMDDRREQ
jgi:Ca2+-binding EF-hand superfamily protein